MNYPKSTVNLICNLLQLNLKLFQDLFRYKHAFNSFQADLNSHLTTIANVQQQQEQSEEQTDKNDKNDGINNEESERNSRDLCETKQKISDMICEKFLQTCQDLGQPSTGQLGDDYESSIYSILAIVDDFNNQSIEDGTDFTLMGDNMATIDDSEMICLSKQIGAFLLRMNRDNQFRRKLLDQLFKKLLDQDDGINDNGSNDNEIEEDDTSSSLIKNLQVEYFEQDTEIQEENETIQHQQPKRLPQYQCKFCLQTFHQVSLLIQHQRNIHRSRFGCARCNQTFRNEYVLRIHLRKDSCSKLAFDPPISIRLPSISTSMSQSVILQTLPSQQVKQDDQQPARNHICRWPGCGKTFTRTSYLSNHMMTHSNDRNYACTVAGCPKRYKTQAHLLNHMNVHRNQEEQESSSGSLQLQQQSISKPESSLANNIYGCQHSGCNFRTTNMVQLQQHISAEHSESTNTAIECPFKCPHCGTSFRKKSSLSNHVKSHSGQFTCAWNGCTFRSHSNVVLSRHMMLHKEGLNISTPDQDIGHGQRSQETEMDRIKTEPENGGQNRPEIYTCKLCDKQFNKRSSIINHVRSHSGQYSCQWPGCYFASQSKMLLRRHVITANHHSDVQQGEQASLINDDGDRKNVACVTSIDSEMDEKQPMRIFHCRYPDCSYQTHKRPLYRVHMLKHSEIRKHRCSWPHCGKSFKAKSTLNRHLVRHRQVAFQQQYRNQSTTLEVKGQDGAYDDNDDYQPIEPMVIIDSQQHQDNEINESIPMATGNNIILFKCEHCPSTFRTKSSLSNHQISHRKPQFRCEKPGCFYETFRSTILERHMRDVHGSTLEPESQISKCTTTIYQCKQQNCRQQFMTMEALQRHLQTSHQQQIEQPTTRTYTCFWPDCRMIFSVRAAFQQHLESHQNRTRRRYGCIGWKDCSRTFQTKRGLLAHYIEHRQQQQRNGEQETLKPQRWLRCIWKGCSYTTTMAEQLKKHLNRHRKFQQQRAITSNSNQDCSKSSSSSTITSTTQKFIAMPFVASITSTSLPTVSTTTL
uniref:Zinc finger protein 594-like n=1 Tax=Dermatophagoides pteronyssinus TaxID=6956 RepID=A0A6P6Y2C8_DERPT|nr:zinc finger protein 594-like [Dermatophagoides pteronyssinus]